MGGYDPSWGGAQGGRGGYGGSPSHAGGGGGRVSSSGDGGRGGGGRGGSPRRYDDMVGILWMLLVKNLQVTLLSLFSSQGKTPLSFFIRLQCLCPIKMNEYNRFNYLHYL